MPDTHLLAPAQRDVLRKLTYAIRENVEDLEAEGKEGDMSVVAWRTRNLLELMIWTMYCKQSDDSAKEFILEAGRDTTDTLTIAGRLFPDDTVPNSALDNFKDWAKEKGLETLEDRYTRVSNIATHVGKGDVFKNFNRFLSKFAHPTALSVLNRDGEAIAPLREKFYRIGKEMAEASLKLIAAP